MLKAKLFTALFVFAALASVSQAADKVKTARSNDVASQYILEDDGDFFRIVNGTKCQITNNVEDFKVSQHKNDAAMVYYLRNESSALSSYETYNLYVLNNASRTGNCPKATKKKILDDVAYIDGKFKYHVVSNTNTTIVNMAMSSTGKFVAWENVNAVVTEYNVEDYTLHNKFGVSGAPFSSYVAFLINQRGNVYKIKGNSPRSSKWDTSRSYSDLKEFKYKNNID